jgi:hypothetical protein
MGVLSDCFLLYAFTGGICAAIWRKVRYICLCLICCVHVSVNNDVGVSWLNCRFVYSIAGQIRSSFVPSLFTVCVIFLSGYPR